MGLLGVFLGESGWFGCIQGPPSTLRQLWESFEVERKCSNGLVPCFWDTFWGWLCHPHAPGGGCLHRLNMSRCLHQCPKSRLSASTLPCTLTPYPSSSCHSVCCQGPRCHAGMAFRHVQLPRHAVSTRERLAATLWAVTRGTKMF